MRQTIGPTLCKLDDAVGIIKEAQRDLEGTKALSPDTVNESDTIVSRLEALVKKVRCSGSCAN